MRLASAASLAVVVSAVAAQSVVWIEGSGPGALAVRSVPEAAPGSTPSTVLDNLTLLAIEITGRTAQQELVATRSRRIVRNGVARVELPGGGRLFAYRRGQSDYGYLRIGPAGTVTVALEAAGSAPASPFAGRLGVGADGGFAAVADANLPRLYVARLDGGTFASTGRAWRTVATSSSIEDTTVMVGPTHAFFATDDERLWRCALADGGQPQEITPPRVAGARLKSELAMSGDGHSVAFLYGVQPSFGIYLAHDAQPTRRLPPADAKYEEPGYLPEFVGGPRMLLDHAGTRLMYVDASSRDETYLLDVTGATAPVHVTSDDNFEPYIGAVILPIFAQSTLVLGVGEPDRLDVYAAETGVPLVANLTRTNGMTQPPFYPGSLSLQNTALAGAGGLLVADRTATEPMRLRRIDLATQTSSIVVANLDSPLQLADAPPGIAPDVLASCVPGDALVAWATGTARLAAPAGVDLTGPVHLDTWVRVLTASAGGISALVFHTDGGALLALPAVSGPQRAFFTAAGNLLIDGQDLLHVSAQQGVVPIATSGAVRIVLSGAGA